MVSLKSLKKSQCTACLPGSPKLHFSVFKTYQKERGEITGWQWMVVDDVTQVSKVFLFSDFKSALDFCNQVGALAEAENHHPAILVEWGRVRVTWWTHSIKGLHLNDLILAAKTDPLYQLYQK